MAFNRYKPVGWRYDSLRHSLAARGIRTYRKRKFSDWMVDMHDDLFSPDVEVKKVKNSFEDDDTLDRTIKILDAAEKEYEQKGESEKAAVWKEQADELRALKMHKHGFVYAAKKSGTVADMDEARALMKREASLRHRWLHAAEEGNHLSDEEYEEMQRLQGEVDKALDKLSAKQRSVLIREFGEQYFAIKRKKPGILTKVKGVPVKAEKLPEGMIYPISEQEVKKVIERFPKETVEGVTSIEFVVPKGEQKNAWAQYVRSKRKVLIFAQPRNGSLIDGQPAEKVRKHIVEYVLPHEFGHHRALRRKFTDSDLAMAEARADANVVGLDPFDRDVVVLRK